MIPVSIADVLRYVEQETNFMQCFAHVLPIQKQVGANQDDLLAILIANATHRGVYGMAQISDRSYEHLALYKLIILGLKPCKRLVISSITQ